jgi:uncharacterized membrane protein YqjE
MAGHDEDTSLTALMRGILDDIRTLVREELELARVEVRQELGKLRLLIATLAVGGITLGLGGLVLLFALSFGAAYLFGWPTWAGFGLIGLIMTVAGGALLLAARSQLTAINPVPPRTAQTVKENLEWIEQKRSSRA